MKYHITTITLATMLIFASTGAHAMWARLSESELIEASILIVIGTLAEFTSATNPSDGQTRTIGVIEIDTVLKGDLGTKFIQLDLPQPGTPVSSSDITYEIGQNGLWFLRLLTPESAGVYAADHPQRFSRQKVLVSMQPIIRNASYRLPKLDHALRRCVSTLNANRL